MESLTKKLVDEITLVGGEVSVTDDASLSLYSMPLELESHFEEGMNIFTTKRDIFFVTDGNNISKTTFETYRASEAGKVRFNNFSTKEEFVGTGRIENGQLHITPLQISPTN